MCCRRCYDSSQLGRMLSERFHEGLSSITCDRSSHSGSHDEPVKHMTIVYAARKFGLCCKMGSSTTDRYTIRIWGSSRNVSLEDAYNQFPSRLGRLSSIYSTTRSVAVQYCQKCPCIRRRIEIDTYRQVAQSKAVHMNPLSGAAVLVLVTPLKKLDM
jgi:hypothetical protein